MDLFRKGWFSEVSELWPGMSLSLKVQKVLHEESSPYQNIVVLQTEAHGKALILDGIIQCTQSDEFAYQEMMAFLPLCSHSCPKKVLIVGGGDGGVAREVIKHPTVDSVHQVEIDERVMEVSKQYLPFMSGSLNHPKVSVHVGDGFAYMASHSQEFDVIITDSSDPIGPAVSLFEEGYFDLLKKALRPGGIICSQVGSMWSNMDGVLETFRRSSVFFPSIGLAQASVPTYPTGQICFLLGSIERGTKFNSPVHQYTEQQLDSMNLRYYCSSIHKTAFIMPRFVQNALRNAGFDQFVET